MNIYFSRDKQSSSDLALRQKHCLSYDHDVRLHGNASPGPTAAAECPGNRERALLEMFPQQPLLKVGHRTAGSNTAEGIYKEK